ncbi:MAG: SDR family NAD(P)-dependent oxidoreductase [Bacteroidales bacterium]|nr:SDR family NAD(P)-dependent oxidoreductase [Bacteroidales bacterium]MDD2322209.1 SDR family NAD(P)-dependent oxidoreductase [Bacteroidales bacterium]MDD3009803.1 SDR family NAD(P)-dependent oxidoreductase [Bacteroidales bacterium]MDD3960313.1 SDR family NAD(P)-dependent oxidoreductase [Bacteroidales bacterium]MDY0284738.1 SDR family NAD(P)-dependent oxidoreductase [Bacteroidales bacterium]
MNKKPIAIITGATSGIGKATALHFAANGYRLVIAGRRENRLTALNDQIVKTMHSDVISLAFDVRNRDEVIEKLHSLPEDWQNPEVLVNNAGLALGLSPLQESNQADWDQMIDTNVKGLLYVSEAVIPWMIAGRKGHIINIGSIAGTEVYPGGNIYCATKHAVNAISKSMRIDLLKHGIKVTQIRPGLAETEFSFVRFKGDAERAKGVYKGYEAMRPDDIASVIFYVTTLPAHVNINDLELTPLAQANSYLVNKT